MLRLPHQKLWAFRFKKLRSHFVSLFEGCGSESWHREAKTVNPQVSVAAALWAASVTGSIGKKQALLLTRFASHSEAATVWRKWRENSSESIMPVFSGANLIGGLLFGSIGFVAFIYGKRMHVWKPMFLGLALMVYPYFVTDDLMLFVIGAVGTAALFLFRE
jgi:hypothetical protein